MADVLLQIEGLTKRFGGVAAADDILLEVPRGKLPAPEAIRANAQVRQAYLGENEKAAARHG